MNNKIVIIDYGVGNISSVANALTFLGYDFVISNKKQDIEKGSSFILAGVGAFDEAMKNLKKLDLINILHNEVVVKKKPILGICLGMQILANSSEEGSQKGLGWIQGKVVSFPKEKTPRIPHVGWNTLSISEKKPLFERSDSGANYYFDHSFYFSSPKKNVLATCKYGVEFAAAVKKDNIYGVQFHPEKSQTNGLKLFRSFFSHYNS
tara:strand:- start:22 stop:642 length:621 start_codon:yes stop_codon:yes gene_type:complete